MKRFTNIAFLVMIFYQSTIVSSESDLLVNLPITSSVSYWPSMPSSQEVLTALGFITGSTAITWYLLKTYGLPQAVRNDNIILVKTILFVKAYTVKDVQEALMLAFQGKKVEIVKILLENLLADLQTMHNMRPIVEPMLRDFMLKKVKESNNFILKSLSDETKLKYINMALDKIFTKDLNNIKYILEFVQNNNAVIKFISKIVASSYLYKDIKIQ